MIFFGLGSIQINQMKPLNPYAFEALGHLERVVMVFFFAAVVALTESDALASDEVDGWNDVHLKDWKILKLKDWKIEVGKSKSFNSVKLVGYSFVFRTSNLVFLN